MSFTLKRNLNSRSLNRSPFLLAETQLLHSPSSSRVKLFCLDRAGKVRGQDMTRRREVTALVRIAPQEFEHGSGIKKQHV
ncbi:unnamed protein product [Arabis nemorensis]|uniref:Uncharacterized protein n=1 Tax=Arabis nemorensis TaxID=586526 RepID=A0A565BDK1_9BRAS|nr:unnamed protein product [Arabis nemorensis]